MIYIPIVLVTMNWRVPDRKMSRPDDGDDPHRAVLVPRTFP
jgi:hypothetical protein